MKNDKKPARHLARHLTSLAMTAAFIALAPATQAQDIVIGTGHADLSEDGAKDGAILSLDYLGQRDWSLIGFDAGLGATMQLHQEGDVFVGAGVQGRRELRRDWFLELSVMPGVYNEGTPENDLGGTFEIRSVFGVGRHLKNGQSVSVALSHISNASTGNRNPGMNALSLRWHVPLGRSSQPSPSF